MSNDRYLVDAAFADHRKQYEEVADLGDAFEVFSADMILRRRRLSIEEVRDGIVGGGKDGGLDGVYIFVNGRLANDVAELPNHKSDIRIEVFFIQAKHSVEIEQIVLQRLQSSLPLFLSLEPDQDKLDKHFNTDLQAASELYRDIIKKYLLADFSVEFHIAYACRSSNSTTAAFDDLADELVISCNAQLGSAKTSFEFLGANRLYKLNVAPVHTRKELVVPPAGLIGNDGNYIALMRLEDFLDFISVDGVLDDNMFEFNVRDFEGDTKPVNKGIAETIKHPAPESNFWWYNNGVTIIASRIVPGQKSLVIHDPMIVNGLQTANVTFANRSAITGKFGDDRRVLVKVIGIDDQELRDGVIKATNSQTSLNSLALRATDDFQRKIEDYLYSNGFFYERRKNFYKNRQMPSSKIIDMGRLGQAVMTLNLHLPDEARARPGTYLNKDTNYSKIFPPGQNLARYLVAAALERRLEAWLRDNRKNYDALYRNNLRFHCLMILSWNLMKKKSKVTSAIDISKATDAEIRKAFEWVMAEYKSAGGLDDNLSKSRDFAVRLADNWKP